VPPASCSVGEQIDSGKTVTEVEVDEKLTARRAAQEGFIECSFPTIAGKALPSRLGPLIPSPAHSALRPQHAGPLVAHAHSSLLRTSANRLSGRPPPGRRSTVLFMVTIQGPNVLFCVPNRTIGVPKQATPLLRDTNNAPFAP
jgi:hypothetical protein